MNPKRSIIRNLAVLTLAGLVSGLVATPVYAVDCAKPTGFVERKACDKAVQGIEALGQYVNRTRSVHGLYIHDYRNALPASDLARLIEQDERAELAKVEMR